MAIVAASGNRKAARDLGVCLFLRVSRCCFSFVTPLPLPNLRYKILFLDVLFPLHVKKIVYVDADQVVRADMKELVELDLHGAPYGYTPFCSSRTEMDGYRFWKDGYWKSHLGDKPYHIRYARAKLVSIYLYLYTIDCYLVLSMWLILCGSGVWAQGISCALCIINSAAVHIVHAPPVKEINTFVGWLI